MTEAYAAATTVSIPIFALAAGAEARTIRDRLRRPDERWEEEFARYSADHDLDFAGKPGDVFAYFRDMPGVSKLYVAERAIAIGGAFLWLVVFVLLTIAESAAWCGWPTEPAGQREAAVFTLVFIAPVPAWPRDCDEFPPRRPRLQRGRRPAWRARHEDEGLPG